MTRYRIDFHPDDQPDAITVIFVTDGPTARRRAMQRARQISGRRDVSAAYAIASTDGKDTGQRVYHYGAYAYQDDRF